MRRGVELTQGDIEIMHSMTLKEFDAVITEELYDECRCGDRPMRISPCPGTDKSTHPCMLMEEVDNLSVVCGRCVWRDMVANYKDEHSRQLLDAEAQVFWKYTRQALPYMNASSLGDFEGKPAIRREMSD